jgi:hypothetical protein
MGDGMLNMNASVVIDDLVADLQRRYGRSARLGKSRMFAFGRAMTCSINYSKMLRGDKYFFGLARGVTDPSLSYPETAFGDFVLLVCGSIQNVLVLPRRIVLQAMAGVTTRRLDIFREGDTYVLQTTGHPKLDVTDFINAYPKMQKATIEEGQKSELDPADRVHVRIQWELIRLGRAEGCSVWVPPLERNLAYQRKRFDQETLDRLPRFGFDENTRRIVENIDVLWLSRNVIRKAFEIESTTMIYSGLLRLNDLVLAQPNNRIDLYIAASRARRSRVEAQLMRPTFQPLLEKCRFIPFEILEAQVARLDEFPAGVKVSGLIEGEQFSLPEHHIYPANI